MAAAATEAYLACMRGNWPDGLILHSGRAPLLIDISAEMTEQLLHLPSAFLLSGLIEPKLEDAIPTFLKIADLCFLRTPAGMSARLMEFNPLVGSTDKCLFSGLPDSYLDGRFLYRHFAPG